MDDFLSMLIIEVLADLKKLLVLKHADEGAVIRAAPIFGRSRLYFWGPYQWVGRDASRNSGDTPGGWPRHEPYDVAERHELAQ